MFTARRGPLDITVMEGGSIRAVESQEIKCEVRVGYQGIKIIKLVDEGYEVTQDDIKTNKVLVELDSSDLQKQIVQQDIQTETAAANLTDAQQNYEIQWNQNLSDITAAEEKVRFARMDFDKFLGDNITEAIVKKRGLEREMAEEQTNAQAQVSAVIAASPSDPKPAGAPTAVSAEAGAAKAKPILVSDPPKTTGLKAARTEPPARKILVEDSKPDSGTQEVFSPPPIDFSKYADINILGDGEAKQKIRSLEDDLQVARKEQGQSEANLEGTKRLFDKGFVTKIDLEKDEIAAENSRLKVQTATTARDLYLKYEFPKTAEEDLSKHSEAARELARARKAAVSKLAQAEAKLKSAQGQYNIQVRQQKELYDQLEKCTITAKRPGLVVYGGNRDEAFFYSGEERIREGATVRERQAIITIPDMTKMSVNVKIHETYIKKVKKGERARITVDAYPDKILQGEVTKVGVLPDSQNMWMNPDLKVYLTTVTIDGTNEWLKPGMTAKVEIFVKRLDDVVYVPIQAVSGDTGNQFCEVFNNGHSEKRSVQVGDYNDEFIAITSGLKPGEQVLLNAAASAPAETSPDQREKPKAAPAAPAPAATVTRKA